MGLEENPNSTHTNGGALPPPPPPPAPLAPEQASTEERKPYSPTLAPEQASTEERKPYSPTLRRGSDSAFVRKVQTLVRKVGGGCDVNGKFDQAFEVKVKKFQKAHGLNPTGVVDEQTWAKLRELNEKA